MVLHTAFGLIWTTPWPNAKELFLKFSKIRNSRNSQNSVWKPNFFPSTLFQFFFASHSHYTGDTPYRVWFDLDNSLTRWKKNLFLKFLFREVQKVLQENPIFFLRKLNQKYFLLNTVITLVKLHTAFGLIWTTPLPDAKELFLKFSKIRNSRNSQNSVWKPNFFPGTLFQFFFALHSHYTGDTPYSVWFNLDNSLTRWKKNLFLKFLFREIQKVLQENPIFFLSKLNQKYFLLNTVITLVKLHTAFGLIWTTPWPNAKELFLKFSKIRNSRNSQNSVWKPNFFPSTLFQFFFCFTLSLHWWYSIPRLVWFGQLLKPMKKKPIFKVPFSRSSKSSVWKPTFFLSKLN